MTQDDWIVTAIGLVAVIVHIMKARLLSGGAIP
jgi:hypothetical protein